MQGIGERLEEARKRKGISLREAAEATKIRGDFLAGIEQDKFDFDLPDIYKNGFVKNYARYLKLDADQVLTDYHAQQLSKTRLGRKSASGTELFGTMEVKKPAAGAEAPARAEAELAPEERQVLGRIDTKTTPSDDYDALEDEERPDVDNDKIFYIKAGLIFVGTLALVVIVFGLIKAILGGGGDEAPAEPQLREEQAGATAPAEPTEPTERAVASGNQMVIEATGPVSVIVKRRGGNEVLYRGPLGAGDRVPITKDGPLEVLFTEGDNLVVETNGERIRPSAPGPAKIRVE